MASNIIGIFYVNSILVKLFTPVTLQMIETYV